MGNDAGAERFIPVHHQTFQLSREPLLEPIERFYSAAGSQTGTRRDRPHGTGVQSLDPKARYDFGSVIGKVFDSARADCMI